MARLDTMRWGTETLRIGPWRGDAGIAFVVPLPGRATSRRTLDDCLRCLADRGFRSVLTSALTRSEQEAFLEADFRVHEHLHLLRHPLSDPIAAPAIDTRRGRRSDRRSVLEVDGEAFSQFWRFDEAGLSEALQATPASRYRVIAKSHEIVGYAVSGRAGPHSYLQRLAVHPHHQGRGLGSGLTLDALRWARRRGAASMLVNTQEHNEVARMLYERLGFVAQPEGMDVLERPLTGAGPSG